MFKYSKLCFLVDSIYVNVHLCSGENYKTDGYVITPKTMQLLAEHLKEINGRVEKNSFFSDLKCINC